jgi:hypothetical protein
MRVGRLIAIAVALTAAGGSAAMALQSARQSTTIDPKAFGTALAKCPNGGTPLSGGFAAPGFDPTGAGATVGRLGSKPVRKGGIETRAFNFGGAAGDIVSYAYCALHSHGLRVTTATKRVPSQSARTVIARCPAGTEAVGGGFGTYKFSQPDGPTVLPLTSKRFGDRGWKVLGVNFPMGPMTRPGTVVAHAYCAAVPYKLITAHKSVSPPPGSVKTFDVPCPSHARAVSGGFDGHVLIQGTQSTATAAITSKRAGGGRVWRTSALSTFETPGTSTAYAYCRKR